MRLPNYEKPDIATANRMRKVRRRGTDIEAAMARLLKEAGLRYQAQPPLKGNPDFRLLGTRIVLFCDSAFWHGRYLNTPKAERFYKNQAFWQAKLEANKRKDQRINLEMRRRGWIVLRFWDEDILKHPRRVLNRILRSIQSTKEKV
jgi:DNA mismatch endonuclease (patch repair protein)